MRNYKLELKVAVKHLYSIQDERKRLSNRLKIKKSKEKQKVAEEQKNAVILSAESPIYKQLLQKYENLLKEEEEIKKNIIKPLVCEFAIFTEFLKDIKGIDIGIAAVIISEFDIHKATTWSKMCAFAGLSPGLCNGKKIVKTDNPKNYEPKSGRVVARYDNYAIVETSEQIRQDKLTEGFLAPFNQFLRSKLLGVLAKQFVVHKSHYSKYYYDRYMPKEKFENGQMGLYNIHPNWIDKKPAHKNNAAKRFMMKIFLLDLYRAWRTLEGLPVRDTYAEEKLGQKHEATPQE